MQFKGVNNKERQQYPRSEVSLKRMRISAVCHPCGVGLAVRGVLSASVAESSRHLALPPSLPLFLSTVFQCDGCLFLSLVRGGSWLGCSVVPAMGALFSLGAGCQKWKPLDIPGTQPPLSDAVVNVTIRIFFNNPSQTCISCLSGGALQHCRSFLATESGRIEKRRWLPLSTQD